MTFLLSLCPCSRPLGPFFLASFFFFFFLIHHFSIPLIQLLSDPLGRTPSSPPLPRFHRYHLTLQSLLHSPPVFLWCTPILYYLSPREFSGHTSSTHLNQGVGLSGRVFKLYLKWQLLERPCQLWRISSTLRTSERVSRFSRLRAEASLPSSLTFPVWLLPSLPPLPQRANIRKRGKWNTRNEETQPFTSRWIENYIPLRGATVEAKV